jgi:alcohol dehydrogenase class IV
VAVITTGETTKAGVSSAVLLPDLAVLDAELTLGLPPKVTAMTGVDAMVHAIEAYTSKLRKNPVSDMLARSALRLLAGNIRTAVHDGEERDAALRHAAGRHAGRPGLCQCAGGGGARAGLSAGRALPHSPRPQ